VAVELIPTTAASPGAMVQHGRRREVHRRRPRVPGSAAKDQLRFRVRAPTPTASPAALSGRKVAEYPNLPGRRENEVLRP
jgi:hypothetical protein